MMLSLYITPKDIVLPALSTNKEELLSSLVMELAKRQDLINPKRMLQSILDRELESSTFLPTGVAIPHTRTPDVSEIKIILGVIPEGFKETPESNPTYLVFLFFSPTQEKEFGKHLKLLSRISSVFSDPEFVKNVAQSKTPEEVFSKIQHREREIAEE